MSRSTDFSILLDAARQLTLAGPPFKEIKVVIADLAINAARSAFENTPDPNEALGILLHLARRQYYDLFLTDSIYKYWDSLTAAKREWLWSQDSRFWEYSSLVILSYEGANMPQAANELTNALLNRPTTPPHGYIQIATTYGEILIKRGEIKASMGYFEKSIPMAPSNKYLAKAYYWRAIIAKNNGDLAGVTTNANLIRRCFGNYSRLFWEKSLDARAVILLGLARKGINQVNDQRYTDDYLASQKEEIEHDSGLLRNG